MSNQQIPLQSGFGPASTPQDVLHRIDLTGKIAIITGGYSGIGTETVRALRGAGAEVIVPARDLAKARAALAGIQGVELAPLDLMDPVSIDAFAQTFLASGRPLHILVNSAGIMAGPLVRDARGYEAQCATNHLGHFQLVAALWPALCRANGARVVSVSSWGHRYSPVVFEDPNFLRRDYDPWLAYGQSKTANILFAVALDQRGQAEGVRAFALHPGTIVGTGLDKHVPREDLRRMGILDENDRPVLDPSRNFKSSAQGAATSVWCAASPLLDGMGGVYCENCDIAPMVPTENEAEVTSEAARRVRSLSMGVLPYSIDPESAERLWRLSEELLAAGLARISADEKEISLPLCSSANRSKNEAMARGRCPGMGTVRGLWRRLIWEGSMAGGQGQPGETVRGAPN